MRKYLKLMRIKHWLKNGLIFLPIVFSNKLFQADYFFKGILGFFGFSLAASSIYIINDLKDIENDRRHVSKCKRPLASGEISPKRAIILCIILILLACLLNFAISDQIAAFALLIFYIILNLIYSLGAKKIVLVDLIILVLGYIIRIYYGATIVGVQVSGWLYLTVMSMAFYLSLGKRRNEIEKAGSDSREVLKKYNKQFLDKNMYMMLGLTIAFYCLWCEEIVKVKKINEILLTVPIVVLICMKYSLVIEGDSEGDPMEVLLNDKILLLLLGAYMVIILGVLYIL